MAKRFSKKYGNKEWAINYMQSKSYVKMPVSAWCYIPTSLPQEQAAKTNNEAAKALHFWIERRWHIPNKSLSKGWLQAS